MATPKPRKEEQQVEHIEERSTPPTPVIYEIVRRYGEDEMARPATSLWWSGLAAGLSMSFSLLALALLKLHLPETEWQRLVVALGYPVGFVMVVLGRQQLFTENTLTPILPLLHNRDLGTLASVLKLWALVLVSNIVGTWAVGSVLAHTSIFEPRIADAFVDLSRHTIEGTFATTLVRGIFAGWLIALMAWLLPATRGSGAHIIVVMTYVVALGEFAHIVAGSVECAFLVQSGRASLSQYAWDFFLPTLLGNILGGTTLVALLNYGQVAAEIDDHRD